MDILWIGHWLVINKGVLLISSMNLEVQCMKTFIYLICLLKGNEINLTTKKNGGTRSKVICLKELGLIQWNWMILNWACIRVYKLFWVNDSRALWSKINQMYLDKPWRYRYLCKPSTWHSICIYPANQNGCFSFSISVLGFYLSFYEYQE